MATVWLRKLASLEPSDSRVSSGPSSGVGCGGAFGFLRSGTLPTGRRSRCKSRGSSETDVKTSDGASSSAAPPTPDVALDRKASGAKKRVATKKMRAWMATPAGMRFVILRRCIYVVLPWRRVSSSYYSHYGGSKSVGAIWRTLFTTERSHNVPRPDSVKYARGVPPTMPNRT